MAHKNLPLAVAVDDELTEVGGAAATATKPAAPVGPQARELKDVAKGLPQKQLLDLRVPTKTGQAAMELSKTLTLAEVGKETVFRLRAPSVEPWPFPKEGFNGWRLHSDERAREGQAWIDVSIFAYVRQDPQGALAAWKKGQDFIVTGTVSRADITAVKGTVLHLDLSATKVEAAR